MRLSNLLHPTETVTFAEAVVRGIGTGGGLFFPQAISRLTPAEIDELLALDFTTRSVRLAQHLLGDEFTPEVLDRLVRTAFTFPAPLVWLDEDTATLELFHGPTLAFKDFGARFMAQVLAEIGSRKAQTERITILSATSGDTGAAVAHAFHGLPGIDVVILYPEGRISPLQEKLFCTLGGNIYPVAVAADFDACQALVKACFADPALTRELGLNSANSINFGRLLAQCFYYFEAVAQTPLAKREKLVVSVPSGNFGNLTAGLLARALGLPIHDFVVATNANDTVPRFLHTGSWHVRPTVATLSNAMDVSAPNNWPRVLELLRRAGQLPADGLRAVTVSDDDTRATLRHLRTLGYVSEPHGAVAYAGLQRERRTGETGIFLGTAHPAKFREAVEAILQESVPLPSALAAVEQLPVRVARIPNSEAALRDVLRTR